MNHNVSGKILFEMLDSSLYQCSQKWFKIICLWSKCQELAWIVNMQDPKTQNYVVHDIVVLCLVWVQIGMFYVVADMLLLFWRDRTVVNCPMVICYNKYEIINQTLCTCVKQAKHVVSQQKNCAYFFPFFCIMMHLLLNRQMLVIA